WLNVQSVSSARFVMPPLTQRKRELLIHLLDQFVDSVNFCIQKCLEYKITSRASLHHMAYEEWKSKFDLATHWFHSAGQVATQTLLAEVEERSGFEEGCAAEAQPAAIQETPVLRRVQGAAQRV
ncbi:MAG: hypothetical protein ACP5KV_05895, partial [Candidatus Methanomethylicaceae archaeon]